MFIDLCVSISSGEELILFAHYLSQAIDPSLVTDTYDFFYVDIFGGIANGKSLFVEAMMNSLSDDGDVQALIDAGPGRIFLEQEPGDASKREHAYNAKVNGCDVKFVFHAPQEGQMYEFARRLHMERTSHLLLSGVQSIVRPILGSIFNDRSEQTRALLPRTYFITNTRDGTPFQGLSDLDINYSAMHNAASGVIKLLGVSKRVENSARFQLFWPRLQEYAKTGVWNAPDCRDIAALPQQALDRGP